MRIFAKSFDSINFSENYAIAPFELRNLAKNNHNTETVCQRKTAQ